MNSLAMPWAGAASRLQDMDEGSALKRLSLLIDFYDRLTTEELATLVDRAVDDLSRATIDGDEADEARYVLEQLVLTLLPSDVCEKAKEVATAAIETMLQDYGSLLSLDTIQSVGEHLRNYGSDKDSAGRASTTALKGYLNELDNWLSDIRSVEELDTFEQDLNNLMKEYDVTDALVADNIERRREHLYERETQDNKMAQGWKPVACRIMT